MKALEVEIVEDNAVATILSPVALLEMNIEPFIASLDVSERTIAAYRSNVGYFIKWVKEQSTGFKHISQYKKYLKLKNLKATTRNAYLTAVRTFFRWLYEEDKVERDYSKNIKSEKIDKEHKKDPLTKAQWLLLMDSLDITKHIDMRDYLILLLGANYGLRSIEIVRLNFGDIIKVKDKWALNLHRKGYEESDKKARPISDEFAELLFEFIGGNVDKETPIFKTISNNSEYYIQKAMKKAKDDEKSVSHSQLERLSTGGLRHSITKRFVELGIKTDRITFHSTRHFAATELIKAKVPILEVRDFMDHKSSTTTEIYIATANRFDNPTAFKLDLAKPTHSK